jgi:RNA polymerase sigma-70 factor (ECF subfamily)
MHDAVGTLRPSRRRYGPSHDNRADDPAHLADDGLSNGQSPIYAAAWRAETVAARVARLYSELFPAVYGFVRFRVGDTHLAEDLTAVVFERALAKLASVRDPDRVRAWLFTIARNVVTDERRRRRPATSLDVADALQHLWVDSPETAALDRDEWRRLVGYLAELDDREREVLGLRFAAGLTNREAGEVVRLTEAHVAQIVHRAVVKLRRRFGHEESHA